VGSYAAVCFYESGVPVVTLTIVPTALFDPDRMIGKVPPFDSVQPREVPGLGAPAKQWVTNNQAVLVVVAGLSTLKVEAGQVGATGDQQADAEVAIAKLVLPRLPGG